MANLNTTRPGTTTPSMPPGGPIASFRTYAEAQRAVDFLSDNRFPVQFVSIVGTDLNMVERVTGRLTYGRVAMAAALSGAYLGMFVGLFFSIFESRSPLTTLSATIPIGAGFGLIYGLISYRLTGGRRDFTSTSQIVAGQYAVWCVAEHADGAQQLLRNLPGPNSQLMSAPQAPAQPGPPAGHSQPGQPPRQPDWYPDPPQQQQPPATMPSGVRLPPGYGPPPSAPTAGGPTVEGPFQGAPYPPGPQFPGQASGGQSEFPGPGGPAAGYPPPSADQQLAQQPGQPFNPGQQVNPGQQSQQDVPQARPDTSGPTYGEMMARRRAEQRAQAEREEAERDAAQRED